MLNILRDKRILIVDDEPDILETLAELLDMCLVDTAPDYESAEKFLNKTAYDAAILDIMGVRGYDLLELANRRGIPALMLTAHALSPDNLVRSIKSGAQSYVPKDKIADVPVFLAELLRAKKEGKGKSGQWFARLKPFFDKKFGPGWREKDKEFWKEFDQTYHVSKDELEDML